MWWTYKNVSAWFLSFNFVVELRGKLVILKTMRTYQIFISSNMVKILYQDVGEKSLIAGIFLFQFRSQVIAFVFHYSTVSVCRKLAETLEPRS